MEGAEFFGIGDGDEGVAEAVGDGAEAEIEGFEDGLPAGGEGAFEFAVGEAFLDSIPAAFHSAVLVKFLGEGHGAGAVGFRTDRFDFMEEGIVVNGVAAVHVADDEVEGVEKDHAEEFVVPDRVAEEFAGTFGLEDAEDEDAVGGAADGIEGEGCELDEFVEEIR